MINEHVYPLRIQIEDTDYTGTVYHSQYLNFMERARSDWIEALGFGTSWTKERQLYFLVHSVTIHFLKPTFVHQQVEIVTQIAAFQPASITFDQYLRDAATKDKLFCKAEIKIACVNHDMRPCAIPKTPIFEAIRRALS